MGQKRLKNARVLVIGAGGLGAPTLLYLAAAGVGTLGIVDFDVVEESNLQRQVIHGVSDVGRAKAESARDSIAEINPLVQVRLHQVRLEASNAVDLFSQYDLILDGTDNFATRYLVNDAAVLARKPYVWGSIFRFEGQVSVFWEDAPAAGDSTTATCTPSRPAGNGALMRRGWCARRAVRLDRLGDEHRSDQAAHRYRGAAAERLMIYDALEMSYRTIAVRRTLPRRRSPSWSTTTCSAARSPTRLPQRSPVPRSPRSSCGSCWTPGSRWR